MNGPGADAPGDDGRAVPDGKALGDAVLARDDGALERAVAMAGSADAAERRAARDAVDAWARRTGKSVRVGLVGTAASAIGALAARLAGSGHRVAVLDAGPNESVGSARAASTENPFAATIPANGLGAADAIRACEIGGYDTVLVAVGTAWSGPPDEVVDCRVGDAPGVDVTLVPGVPHEHDVLDALWRNVRRWHWDAIEDGTFAARRARQQDCRDP